MWQESGGLLGYEFAANITYRIADAHLRFWLRPNCKEEIWVGQVKPRLVVLHQDELDEIAKFDQKVAKRGVPSFYERRDREPVFGDDVQIFQWYLYVMFS